MQQEIAAPASSPESFGLKEDWGFIEKTLEGLIPVYDKVNRYISLGRDLKLRMEGLELLKGALGSSSNYSIIDLGCGPGKMTQMLVSKMNNKQEHDAFSLLGDALMPMMKVAKERNSASEGALLVYENLPFRENSFDAAMAGFAIRDAKNLSSALREINRILKKESGGFFLIVDLGKPDSSVKRGLVGFYWRAIAPFLAFIACGRKGLKFAALSTTYTRLPKNSEFLELVELCGFEILKRKLFMLDGACILLLKKKVI